MGVEFVELIIWRQRFKLSAEFKKKRRRRKIGLVNVSPLRSYTFYKITDVRANPVRGAVGRGRAGGDHVSTRARERETHAQTRWEAPRNKSKFRKICLCFDNVHVHVITLLIVLKDKNYFLQYPLKVTLLEAIWHLFFEAYKIRGPFFLFFSWKVVSFLNILTDVWPAGPASGGKTDFYRVLGYLLYFILLLCLFTSFFGFVFTVDKCLKFECIIRQM